VTRRRENGAALLILLALIGVVFGVLLVTTLSGTRAAVEREQRTSLALGKARDALIGRAAADVNRPGSLPCPDLITNNPTPPPGNVPNDGIADLFAGTSCPSYVGRLPWATLDLADLRDGDGERLWYALSPKYRDHPAGGTLNSDTAGELTVTGTHAATDVVAIVFSASSPIGAQDRLAGPNAVGNYLEGDNANGDVTYESGPATATFNDQMLVITRSMLMPVVEQRVARQARRCLENYALSNGGRYPFAAQWSLWPSLNEVSGALYGRIPSTLLSGTWPPDNPDPGGGKLCFETGTWWDYWRELLLYRVSAGYAPSGGGFCGTCLWVNGQNRVKFVVIVGGGALTPPGYSVNQSLRAVATNKIYEQYYLEPYAALNNVGAFILGTTSFAKEPRAAVAGNFNDRVECVRESGLPPCD
jgi:type II secretory pathway pseudopilin PulG